MSALMLVMALSLGGNDNYLRSVQLEKDHFINLLAVWGTEPSGMKELAARVTYSPPGTTYRTELAYRPGGTQPSPMATLKFSGKWWNIFNDFARNPGVMWTYKDKFMVQGRGGWVQFDRSELEEYPALQRRAHNATWSFERVEVQLRANRTFGSSINLTFTHDGVQMSVPAEGKQPVTAPGSPRKWSDAVKMAGVSEKDMPKVWRELSSAGGVVSIHFVGLQFPDEELASIMKDAKERKEKQKELNKEYETIFDDYAPPVKPFRGGGDDAKPYEPRLPEVASSSDQYRLMLGSREIKSWPRSEVTGVERVPSAPFFKVNTVRRGVRLFDRRGQEREIGGHREFLAVARTDSGKLIARAELSRESPEKAECYAAFGQGWSGPYDFSHQARDQVKTWVRNAKEHWDKWRAESKGGINICIPMQYELVDVYEYELEPATLAVKHFTRRYMIWGSRYD